AAFLLAAFLLAAWARGLVGLFREDFWFGPAPVLGPLRLSDTGQKPPGRIVLTHTHLIVNNLIFNKKAGSIRSMSIKPQLTGSHSDE
ncbi:MAG: hypothetical protein SV765_05190, partial [Pseudomonadota bacterium]|nr:hypothetical protein [Pseudomonadota bacterium]